MRSQLAFKAFSVLLFNKSIGYPDRLDLYFEIFNADFRLKLNIFDRKFYPLFLL